MDLDAPYTVPDPAGLFNSARWLLNIASLQHYRGEQHTGQRRTLTELLLIASRYAPRRGLVEPVLVFHPRNATLWEDLARRDPALLASLDDTDATATVAFDGARRPLTLGIYAVPAGGLLDMRVLGRAVGRPIIPYAAFAALTNGTLDELVVSNPALLGRQEALHGCDDDAGADAPAAGELFGENWTVRRRLCGDGHIAFGRALGESRARALGVAYTKGRIGPRFLLQWTDLQYRYFRCRAALRPTAAVAARALGFLRREFDAAPFLAVQWRRGDRVFYRAPELSPGPETVVAAALAAAAQQDLVHVYLMTNSGTPEEVEWVLGKLRGHGLVAGRLGGPDGWREDHARLVVETAIASFSEWAVVSPCGVSGTILEERVLLGYGTRTWAHLVPDTFYAAMYDELVGCVEKELDSDADLGAAVRAQADAGRRALECAQDLDVPVERCARMVVESGRALAERAWPTDPPEMEWDDSDFD
jgi:hypothetical protein